MKPNIIPFTDPNAPRAPFEQGSTPRAGWFCVETTFCHQTPQPGSMARAHGLSPKNESEALALCVQHGIDKEVATADTLAQLAATFERMDATGRGVLLTRDHAGLNADPDTRACGWLRALHADGKMLWAWIELTPFGHELIDGGEFAFFSTEYIYADFKKTANGAEPMRLAGCTLTNMPRHKAQPSCTNMAQGGHTARNTQTQNNDMNTDPDKTPAADNDDIEDDDKKNLLPPAADNDDDQDKNPAADNDDDQDKTPAADNDDNDDKTADNDDNGEVTMESVVQQLAELMDMPETATPADFLASVKALKKSNDELRAALAEANKGATGTNSLRFPGLSFARNSKHKPGAPLRGNKPNAEVQVRVGNGTVAVNSQAKAKADYCTAAVAKQERALGRRLSITEYNAAYSRAASEYDFGHKR